MPNYNVHEAKSNFSKLLKEVEQGEDVVIMRNAVPVAKLVRNRAARRPKVQLGWASEDIRETRGWDKAMSKAQAAAFLGQR